MPPIIISLMAPFRSFFTVPVWEHVLALITGMVLAPGKRAVSAALRVMGLGAAHDFALYHYVLTGVRDPQAFLCTDLDATPVEILGWFVSRWSIETTFQESRAHLGVETQRQWSDLAIARTTPALFGLFSLVTLWAADPKIAGSLRPRSTAWYHKRELSFSDAMAAIRKLFWSAPSFSMSRHPPDSVEIPAALWERLTEALCYAA